MPPGDEGAVSRGADDQGLDRRAAVGVRDLQGRALRIRRMAVSHCLRAIIAYHSSQPLRVSRYSWRVRLPGSL